MTVLEVIQRSTEFLQQKGVESPRLQIELMLAHVLQLPRLKLYMNFDRVLLDEDVNRLREMVRRRAAREPLQHIVGTTSFCGLEIKCSAAALVPRPETELLAERAWQFLKGSGTVAQDAKALDFGTGTGCIAIALAVNVPGVTVYALDISGDALSLARQNAEVNGVAGRIHFLHGDGFSALPAELRFDVLVSNPPYIASGEIPTLQPEVREFDPRLALEGGGDGLDFYRRIAQEAPPFLERDGKAMLEFGDGQSEAVKNIFENQKWIVEEIVADYSSRPRILIARRD
jgi:release factor glutamine methyltransferase